MSSQCLDQVVVQRRLTYLLAYLLTYYKTEPRLDTYRNR